MHFCRYCTTERTESSAVMHAINCEICCFRLKVSRYLKLSWGLESSNFFSFYFLKHSCSVRVTDVPRYLAVSLPPFYFFKLVYLNFMCLSFAIGTRIRLEGTSRRLAYCCNSEDAQRFETGRLSMPWRAWLCSCFTLRWVIFANA